MIRSLVAFLVAGLLAGSVAALELTPQEAAGRRIYREGIGAAGTVAARVGIQDTTISGAAVPCANCHGEDGKGRPEGGLRPPEITWRELSKPYGHRHDSGRDHPPFDVAGFLRAVTTGTDPAGHRLDPGMPRYALAGSDADALAAYLKRIDDDHDPGIDPSTLRLGTVLPRSGPLAETGRVVEKVIQGVFDRINAQGGIYGRRLELVVLDAAGPAPLGERLGAADVLALVGPLAPGASDQLFAAAEDKRLPVVGPLAGETGDDSRYIFRLAPGEKEQGRSLAEFAVRRLGLDDPRVILVAPPSARETVAAVEGQLAGHGWRRVSHEAPGRDPAAAVADWRSQGVEALFFFGPREELAALQGEATALGWQPAFLASAAHAPAGGPARLFVAAPSIPGEGTAAGRQALAELRHRQGLPAGQQAIQAAAYGAALVLAEGLKRSGRAASRDRLVDALENLYAFDTGVTPPVAFGPGRRVGVMGAHVLAFDPATGRISPAGGFVQLE